MNREILELAAQAEPELMNKTAQAVELIERMAPEFLDEVVQEFRNISDVTKEKVAAGVGPGLKPLMHLHNLGKGAIGVAAIAGTAIGASLGTAIASDLFDAAKRGLTKSRNFKRIMDSNPKLKDEIIDKSRIKPTFDALHRFAPDFMSDPLVGASLLKSVANQPGGNEYQIIEKLIGSRKNLIDIKDKQHRPDWKGARELLKSRSSKEPGE